MKTISIDFDGVIHRYSKGWADGTCYDEPVEGSLDFIAELLDKGYSVFILSTRNVVDIRMWLVKHGGMKVRSPHIIAEDTEFWNGKAVVGITNRKLPAHVYIDDRGLKFEGYKGLMEAVEEFKTWQNK